MLHLPCATKFQVFEPLEQYRDDCPYILVTVSGEYPHPIPLPQLRYAQRFSDPQNLEEYLARPNTTKVSLTSSCQAFPILSFIQVSWSKYTPTLIGLHCFSYQPNSCRGIDWTEKIHIFQLVADGKVCRYLINDVHFFIGFSRSDSTMLSTKKLRPQLIVGIILSILQLAWARRELHYSFIIRHLALT